MTAVAEEKMLARKIYDRFPNPVDETQPHHRWESHASTQVDGTIRAIVSTTNNLENGSFSPATWDTEYTDLKKFTQESRFDHDHNGINDTVYIVHLDGAPYTRERYAELSGVPMEKIEEIWPRNFVGDIDDFYGRKIIINVIGKSDDNGSITSTFGTNDIDEVGSSVDPYCEIPVYTRNVASFKERFGFHDDDAPNTRRTITLDGEPFTAALYDQNIARLAIKQEAAEEAHYALCDPTEIIRVANAETLPDGIIRVERSVVIADEFRTDEKPTVIFENLDAFAKFAERFKSGAEDKNIRLVTLDGEALSKDAIHQLNGLLKLKADTIERPRIKPPSRSLSSF